MEEEVKVELPEAVGIRVDANEGATWNGEPCPPQWHLHPAGFGWEERYCGRTIEPLYTADQMREAILAERERAAQIAESQPRCDPMDAEMIAAAIRKG